MRRVLPFLLALSFVNAFAGEVKQEAKDKAHPSVAIAAKIALKSSDGLTHTPLAERGQKVTVLVFLMHDCPVTSAMAPELARLATEFTPRGVQFFGVYVTETAKEISTHRDEYGLPFPGLLDPELQLARIAGATRAPEAAVFALDGTLLYRGRIDDRVQKPGTIRAQASRRDLRLALESVLAGRKPEPRLTTSVGCYLPPE